MEYKPIEEYGVIGDLHSVAMVATDGSIDFLCLPRFDSGTVFAALLDDARGGTFAINPAVDGARSTQLYLPETNVLLTRFLTDDGIGEVTDFMPADEPGHPQAVVRRVKGVRRDFRFRLRCAPRFDYARTPHRTEQRPGEVLFLPKDSNGTEPLRLRMQTSPRVEIDLRTDNGDATAEFTLGADQRVDFVLETVAPDTQSLSSRPGWVDDAFTRTVTFWRKWVSHCTYSGRWREDVIRSALALKLLTSADYGSIAAAATFGLPECAGGPRNWDYRYTWIRDASLTAATLLRLGFTDEPRAYLEWVLDRYRAADEPGKLQIMYGIDGRQELTEQELSSLEGYKHSTPVRIGNAAYDQLQLDIYGELLDLIASYDERVEPVTHELWQHLRGSADWVADNWRRPDDGIWEVRGGRQKFLYSRLLCWVALDRACRIAGRRSLPGPHENWSQTRDTIYNDIHENFWDPQRGAFVQHRGSTTLDASTLLMPLVGFVSPWDPRWHHTLDAIQNELVEDSLVRRYLADKAAKDGLTGDEGTFCMCSYWLIDCLARRGDTDGDLDSARLFFDKMQSYSNHLGLYAEEMDKQGYYTGNFPQAFTHVGHINTALSLDHALSRSQA
ncbi:glycoside hydrolase family 15 protein [Streptomyces sp. NPDC058442]|uniref:glycoside hydrolase family 15 protein n=1 Tax=Streptomyces sp. NPDC058442 TaxID=3346503 RepID=UPI0036681A44